MARKTRITFNFTYIIAAIIAYNLFFGDDDKTEVDIQDQEVPAIVEQTETSSKKELTAAIKKASDAFKVVAKEAIIEIQDRVETKTETPPEPEPEEERQEELVAEPEKPAEELKPLTEDKPTEGMKRL